MFTSLALATVLMSTSCGGGFPHVRPAAPPALALAPAPSLAEQLPLLAKIGLFMVAPPTFRSAAGLYLFASQPTSRRVAVATPKAACPLCAGHAGIPSAMMGKRLVATQQVHTPAKKLFASPAVPSVRRQDSVPAFDK